MRTANPSMIRKSLGKCEGTTRITGIHFWTWRPETICYSSRRVPHCDTPENRLVGQPRLAHTDSHVSRHEWHHKQQHLFKERQRAKRQRVKERRVANRVVGVATDGETNRSSTWWCRNRCCNECTWCKGRKIIKQSIDLDLDGRISFPHAIDSPNRSIPPTDHFHQKQSIELKNQNCYKSNYFLKLKHKGQPL